MMLVSHDYEATKTTTEVKMRVTEKNTLQLNICLDEIVSISEKLAAVKCSANTKTTLLEGSRSSPSIRSGSHTDIGARKSNEDQHIHIDDVSKHMGNDVYKWANLSSSFYVVFDGHGGPEAASYVKDHAMRLFFEGSDLPQVTTLDGSVDELFLKALQDSHCKAFLKTDQDLKEECSISDYCGTTALTVSILGRHLLIANAGDCRAVISRRGRAMQMSNDHRPVNHDNLDITLKGNMKDQTCLSET